MKIYIIKSHEDIEWSDQDSFTDAVFTTRELAEEYKALKEEQQVELEADSFECRYFWTIEEHEVRDNLDFENNVDFVKGYDNFEGYDI